MAHTKWKQDFFALVEPIPLRDPLASLLGATRDDEPIYYGYQECVKLAGHACASVSSAFQMTKLALKALYGEELPVRGEIEVRFAGGRDAGANGPIGQVIAFITGAAIETGFHGLGGKHVRSNTFVYDDTLVNDGDILVHFKRTDTGAAVAVRANPSAIPMTDEEKSFSALAPNVIHGRATDEEREAFYRYWQGKNKKILLEDHPEVFYVEPLS